MASPKQRWCWWGIFCRETIPKPVVCAGFLHGVSEGIRMRLGFAAFSTQGYSLAQRLAQVLGARQPAAG